MRLARSSIGQGALYYVIVFAIDYGLLVEAEFLAGGYQSILLAAHEGVILLEGSEFHAEAGLFEDFLDLGIGSRSREKIVQSQSGFIAGGALMGVVSALLRFFGINLVSNAWMANHLSEVCSLCAYILLIAFFIWATKVKSSDMKLK